MLKLFIYYNNKNNRQILDFKNIAYLLEFSTKFSYFDDNWSYLILEFGNSFLKIS